MFEQISFIHQKKSLFNQPVRAGIGKKNRYSFIDQFRGWAVLLMLETHVLNGFLRQDLFSSFWYKLLDFVNGLVAPAFLFLAGYSFAIVAQHKWKHILKLDLLFWKQLGRYVLIVMIGYLLRLPNFSFHWVSTGMDWRQPHYFWGVDILHCIGASLIVMLLLIPLFRRQAVYYSALAVLGILILFSTRLIYALPVETVAPAAWVGYIKRVSISRFPLFPWLAFALFGAACSYLWQRSRETSRQDLFFARMTPVSLAATILTSLLILFLSLLTGKAFYTNTSPIYSLFKLSLLVLILTYFWTRQESGRPGLKFVAITGQESLLAYTFHILVIYGAFWCATGRSLQSIIGQTRPVSEVLLMITVLALATVLLALGWHHMKSNFHTISRGALLIFWLLLASIFFLR